MVLLGEGGENEFNTNINFLLEEYGMAFNNGIKMEWFNLVLEKVIDLSIFQLQTQWFELIIINIFILRRVWLAVALCVLRCIKLF